MRRRYFLRRWLPTILWSVVLMALVALILVGIYSLVQWDKVRNTGAGGILPEEIGRDILETEAGSLHENSPAETGWTGEAQSREESTATGENQSSESESEETQDSDSSASDEPGEDGGEDPDSDYNSEWPYLDYYRSINSDVIGYIYVPGTYVDEPVLRSQDWEDPDYYLMHRIDYSYGYPGCVYMQNYNSADFSDPMTILYGHNMYDYYRTFSSLHYLRDPGYLETYHYIYIYTPTAKYVYDIFAVYPFDSRHILFMCNFNDPNSMQNYLETEVFGASDGRAIYRNVPVNGYSKILTLSTCMFPDEPDLRFLVQGVLVSVE